MERSIRSIKDKIRTKTIIALLLLAVTLSLGSIFVVQQLGHNASNDVILRRCEEETLRCENKLNLVRHAVTTVDLYAREVYKLGEYELYSEDFEEQIRNLTLAVANDTDGAMAVYCRYNPELTGNGTGGFFWSRKDPESAFGPEPPTDILAYPADDIEHVGWFYVPKEKGEPLWMSPYYNKNLDVFMISYIIPIYDDEGIFYGVIGMDIDFASILKTAGEKPLYTTGRIGLADISGKVFYCAGEDKQAAEGSLSDEEAQIMVTMCETGDITTVTDGRGIRSLSCAKRLSNDMVLYLTAPIKEINGDRNRLITFLLVATAVICGITFLALGKSLIRIVEPIHRLVKVSRNYTAGNWEEQYTCETGDELQELSACISEMATQTKDYIERLNRLVRIDALTGMRNRTSYMEMVEEILENRHGRFDRYAIVVMDLNYLKQTNDSRGHDAGDLLIKEAGRYICDCFKHSPVFRIGGDEFVAILRFEDYENKDDILAAFEQGMGYMFHDMAISISHGVSDTETDGHDFNENFRRADDRMYENKARIHKSLNTKE